MNFNLKADVTFKGFYQELFLYGFAAQRNFAEVKNRAFSV
jgi:hypothetical protein